MDRTTTTLVRGMMMADLQAVLDIDHLSFPIPWSERTYKYEIEENPSSHMHVVEVLEDRNPRVVGYIGFWFIVDEAHISTLAVHPDYRGQGIGELLLDTALKHAVELGVKIVTLEVRVSNHAAINLYRKYDFIIVGSRPRYYRDNNEDALLMTREN
ncbi:MAG: ribosomal-protein-alanine N-acetyltransferase [Chloroflexi bacterium RBG_16_48_8]|nr:MAG: ribosomal-protein-alanine N-acetyltransferase [Chloroflexi bacterium RBG_16_48_8]